MKRWLIEFEPGNKILFCGPRASKMREAALAWLSFIGRAVEADLLMSRSCQTSEKFFAVVATRIHWDPLVGDIPESVKSSCPQEIDLSAATVDERISECKRKSGANFRNRCFERIWFAYSRVLGSPEQFSDRLNNPLKIYLVEECHMVPLLNSTLLHEMGHILGICDQYDNGAKNFEAIGFHQNCDEKFRSKTAQQSIMNARSESRPVSLTTDDMTGIRLLACRRDIAANQSWLLQMMGEGKLDNWNWHAIDKEMQRIGYSEFDNLCVAQADYLNSKNRNQ